MLIHVEIAFSGVQIEKGHFWVKENSDAVAEYDLWYQGFAKAQKCNFFNWLIMNEKMFRDTVMQQTLPVLD